MSVYLGIGSAAHKMSKLYAGIDGKARQVRKMYIGVNGQARLVYQISSPIGSLAVGRTVKIKVGGVAKDFIVVHQGKPSSVYDNSCSGTWLLMKDIYTNSKFGRFNYYNESSIHSYLNSTFFNQIDGDIRNAIKQVKIPYHNGNSVDTGSNGLSTKVFLLSGYEVGWTTSDDSYFPKDGAKLNYFGSGSGGNSKRIAYNGSSAAAWWLRSPGNYVYSVWIVRPDGSYYDDRPDDRIYGVRPALILPKDVPVDESGNILVG